MKNSAHAAETFTVVATNSKSPSHNDGWLKKAANIRGDSFESKLLTTIAMLFLKYAYLCLVSSLLSDESIQICMYATVVITTTPKFNNSYITLICAWLGYLQ